MHVDKKNTVSQWIVLFCICLFPCGAYFVFDAPAALQRYFQAGLEITATEYMDYYVWYSMPNIVMCIFAGILVDNVFGRRLGAAVFCAVVFVGQTMFATGIAWSTNNKNWTYLAKLGRTVVGTGVESIAVCSKSYLGWWYKGTPMMSFAFGVCIAFWRVSSSFSLMFFQPYYNEHNTVIPRDGIIEEFRTCKNCLPNDQSDKKPEEMINVEVFPEDTYSKSTTYYCYDKNTIDSCQMQSLKQIDFWNQNNFLEACPKFDQQTEQFLASSHLISKKCFDPNEFVFDQEKCNCLDPEYYPVENTWKWADSLYHGYSSSDSKLIDEYPQEVYDSLQDPFYWIPSAFGEYLSGDLLDKKIELFRHLNKLECDANQDLEIPLDLERYASTENDTWSVKTFVASVQRPALYSYDKDCNKSTTYLVEIPKDDTDQRISSLASCYYLMLVVTIFATFVAGFLAWYDKQAVDTYAKENPEKKEAKPEPVTLSSMVAAVKKIPIDCWIVYFLVVCFYVPVFIFIPQAPKFFEDHVGLTSAQAPQAAGLLYLLAVPITPTMGFIVTVAKNHMLFLVSAFVCAGLGHFIMLIVKGFLSAAVGMFLLSLGYGLIGCCLWPLIAVFVDQNLVGKAYGLAYATQQLGLTIAGKLAGMIVESMGFYALEVFFISLCLAGTVGSVYMLMKNGRHMPDGEKKKEELSKEQEALKEDHS